jgi:ABC-type multidrug transport system fused ATPase/permease subunit
MQSWRHARSLVLRILGIPSGVGILFSRQARVRLSLVLLGSLSVALLEMVAVAAVLPLMQLLTGAGSGHGVLGRLADLFGTSTPNQLAVVLALVIFLGFITKAAMTLLFRWWMLGTLMRQEIETSTTLLTYYLRAPYALHLQRHTGELLRNMNEAVGQVYSFVVGGTLAGLGEMMSVTAVVVCLLVVQPVPTLVVMGYFGIAAWFFQRRFRGRMEAAGEVMMTSSLGIYRAATQALGGVKDIQLRGSEGYFLGRFERHRTIASEAGRSRAFLSELPKHVMEVMFIVGVGIMTVVVFAGEPSGEALSLVALFAAAGFRVLPSVVRSMAALNAVRVGRPALDLVLEDMGHARRLEAAQVGGRRQPLAHSFELDDVHFRYAPDLPDVLRGINLSVPAGTSVALVGGSGAGKTTLVDLMAGFHQPTRGRVLRDGVDIWESIAAWRAGVAIVPQTVFLTDGPFRENIAFGVEPDDVDEQQLERVVDQAQLRELLAEYADGVDTPIGESGDRLSGGQRQRIGVARALYAEPTFLILDEATSSLDNETERRVTQTVEALAGRVTTVVVAHRLSTVKNCDQIVFLKDGVVAACGTFDEVRSMNEDFERLVTLGNLIGS